MKEDIYGTLKKYNFGRPAEKSTQNESPLMIQKQGHTNIFCKKVRMHGQLDL